MTRAEAQDEVKFVFHQLRTLMDDYVRLGAEMREANFCVNEGVRPQRSIKDIRHDQKVMRTSILACGSLTASLRLLIEIEGLEDDADDEA